MYVVAIISTIMNLIELEYLLAHWVTSRLSLLRDRRKDMKRRNQAQIDIEYNLLEEPPKESPPPILTDVKIKDPKHSEKDSPGMNKSASMMNDLTLNVRKSMSGYSLKDTANNKLKVADANGYI